MNLNLTKKTHEIKIEIDSDIIHLDIKDIFYSNIWKLEKVPRRNPS